MCRLPKYPSSLALPGACAFLLSLLALLPAAAAAAVGTGSLNGPGDPQGGRLALGDLAVSSPENCVVAYTLQVQSEGGGGNDTFELQLFDDGALVQAEALSAPADGAVHALTGTIHLHQAVSQVNPGLGVYLVDSGAILDFVDPAPVSCGFVEIPTLDAVGAWILGGLLLASALVVLRRRAAASI
jgi:hypothetical protein